MRPPEFEYNLLIVDGEREVRNYLVDLFQGKEVMTEARRAILQGDYMAGGILEQEGEYDGEIDVKAGETTTKRRLHIQVAETAQEAMQRLQHYQDVVILDLALSRHHLERRDAQIGMRLLEEIKHLASQTEVIVMTSSTLPDLAVHAIDRGAFYFVDKPIRGDFLTALVRAVIARRETEYRSHFDPLTGVYTRALFDLILEQEVNKRAESTHLNKRGHRPLSVILADIDHFKRYNDRYGHLAGDAALRLVAEIMSSSLRKGDTLGRCGGEEFGIVLPNTGQEEAPRLAERLRQAVERGTFYPMGGDTPVTVTISLGVATHPPFEPDDLYRIADEALVHCAKKRRNVVCGYDPGGQTMLYAPDDALNPETSEGGASEKPPRK